MGGSIFGSSSDQKSKTANTQRNITASGNAVVNTPKTTNSGNLRYNLGKGATIDQRQFTTVQGISEDQLAGILDKLNQRQQESGPVGVAPSIPTSGGTDSPGTSQPDAIGTAIEDRIADQVQSGSPTEQKKMGWLIGGVVALGLAATIAVVLILKRGKAGAK